MEVNGLFWIGFLALTAVLIAADLLMCRGKHIGLKKALWMTVFWIAISLAFGVFVWIALGSELGLAYYTGYVIEKAMSIDNLFVFILIFSFFGIPDDSQHKALYYGVIGALVLRAAFIFAGAELINRFEIAIYIFGAILVLAAIKTVMGSDGKDQRSGVAEFLSKHLRTSPGLDGQKLFTRMDGKLLMTPLFLCIIVIEVSDIIFAVDSVPAVLAITTNTFVVYTSNIFAVLGLRSLYFAVRESLRSLKYLKYGLGGILLFVGAKMLLSKIIDISVIASLAVILGILAVTVLLSLYPFGRKRTEDDPSA